VIEADQSAVSPDAGIAGIAGAAFARFIAGFFAAFLTAGFFAAAFLAAGFFAAAFFGAAFFAAGFFTAAFLAAGFFAAAFFTAGFFATAFFFGAAFFTAFAATAAFADFFAGFFTAAFLAAGFFTAAFFVVARTAIGCARMVVSSMLTLRISLSAVMVLACRPDGTRAAGSASGECRTLRMATDPIGRAADIDAQAADSVDVLDIDVAGTWRAKHSPTLLRDLLRWCRIRLPPINRTFP